MQADVFRLLDMIIQSIQDDQSRNYS